MVKRGRKLPEPPRNANDPAQSRAFIRKAREAEVDESSGAMDRAFERVMGRRKKPPTASTRRGCKLLQISTLPENRIPEAVSVLTEAFMENAPIVSHYFPLPEDRREVFTTVFDDLIRSQIGFGHVYSATLDDTIIGVAVWHPPNVSEHRERNLAAEQRVRDINPQGAEAMRSGFKSLRLMHPSEPHWYLPFAGILPIHQSRGFGSRLLAPVLDISDRSNTVCYLETPSQQTHAFYRRLGFEITWEGHPFSGAPIVWTMTRKPRDVESTRSVTNGP